ncbi:MAG: hypothetical protein QOI76_3563 [Frankiales bacterium]|jgi:N-acetylneuraminic acid mutarotase|nr:hypothetical protein [Frankiales bacterium]
MTRVSKSVSARLSRTGRLVLALVVVLLGLSVPHSVAHAASVTIMVSASPNRAAAVPLAGTTRAGNLYIFTTPDAGVVKVSFWLDDPQRAGLPKQLESWAPFDFRGGSSTANPWDSGTVANGTHVITAQVVDNAKVTTVVSASFQVLNGSTAGYAPQFSTASDRSAPLPLAGAVLKGTDYVFVPSAAGMTKVSFYLDDMQRVNAPAHIESTAPFDFAGTGATLAVALPWATTALSNGTHVLSVDVQTASGVKRVDTTFSVLNPVTPPPPPSGFVSHYTYTPIAPLPIGTTEANSVTVNDKVYLFGGFDVLQPVLNPTTRAWVYDPVTNIWSSLPPVPAMGIDHAGIDTDGSRYIYYAGGFRYDTTGAARLQGTELVWRYDTQTGTYSPMPPLPVRRASGGLSYIGGTLYYFAGSTDYQGTPDAGETFSLDVAGGATAWVQRATMPNPRNHIGWVTIDGKIYVAGGQYFEKSYFAQSELDRYDPATDTWTTLAPMPFARSHMLDSSMVIDGRFVVASGWTTTAQTAAVTAYDPVTDTWSSMTDLPLARTSATARALSGGRFVYCCGSAGISTSSGWMATPAP